MIASATTAYIPKDDHRDGTPEKSQWIIPPDMEVAAFRRSSERGWLIGRLGWGLHLTEGGPNYLGRGARGHDRQNEQLFMAKFVEGSPGTWHGYPADYAIHPQDVPPVAILQAWTQLGLISLSQQRKIMRSQRCAL